MRIKAVFSTFAAIVVFVTSQFAYAEERICLPQACDNHVDHLAFSREYANIIAVGSFAFSNASKQMKIGENRYLEMTFTSKKVLKGAEINSNQKIQVPISEVIFSGAKKDNRNIDLYSIWKQSTANSDRLTANDGYATLEKMFSEKAKGGAASSVNLALVKLSVGGLDAKIRVTSTPIFEGRDYVLFLFKDYLSEDDLVFPSEWNIYPLEL